MSDSGMSDNPPEIYEAANKATLNLLPDKSRQTYLKQYESFMEWCKTLMVKNNIEISKCPKLIAFLKKQNVGYQAKKSAVFTRSDLSRFLTEAPDQDYLMWKVCLIIGLAGACRRDELRKISINDIQDKGNMLIITIPDTKTNKSEYLR
ncbi:hypothetical protein NQ317_003721 [Molorchus minor]|uniref:Tyr recombinase domain-containing protein n=1 Tax=Molorchus minor TaxID=1323400 RepID=A0ABQ9JEY7_9CUCU|nr:hypothetical protein NQ317_003721 [Molorchus minor]